MINEIKTQVAHLKEIFKYSFTRMQRDIAVLDLIQLLYY